MNPEEITDFQQLRLQLELAMGVIVYVALQTIGATGYTDHSYDIH